MTVNSRTWTRSRVPINGRVYGCYERGNCDAGRAGDIVFFNGLLYGASSWAYQTRIPALLKRFRVLLFDYPSQGDSSAPTEGMTADNLVEDVLALLAHFRVSQPLLVGHSFGGLLAGLLAGVVQSRPQLGLDIAGLLVVNGSLRTPRSTNKLFWEMQRRLAQIAQDIPDANDRHDAVKDIFRFFLPVALGDDYLGFVEDFEEDVLNGYAEYNRNVAAVAALLKVLLENNVNQAAFEHCLAQVRCPVRIVTGLDDKIFPQRYVQELVSVYADAELVGVEHAGHSVMVEQHTIFNQHFLQFLDRLFDNAPGAGEPAAAVIAQ